MSLVVAITALLVAALALPAAAEPAEDGISPYSDDHERVPLWLESAPQAAGTGPIDTPAITVHLPASDEATGAGMVVCPGGAYEFLASDHEGIQVARWLNSVGVAAFVLRYRLKPKYEPAVAFMDGQRAIRYVRYNAERFGVSPDRIGMMGFSAGAHLSSWVGTKFDSGNPVSTDPVERMSSRPDFLVLVYPGTSPDLFESSRPDFVDTVRFVTDETPPTFLFHGHEDEVVASNHSIAFYQALLKAGVAAELHIFQWSWHGVGLAPGDPDVGQWPMLATRWMRRNKFLTDAERVAVTGRVIVDGEPLLWGWVTLIPEDDSLPVAATQPYVTQDGTFELDDSHGPCPGRHRVEVRLVAKDVGQSRDPSSWKDGSYSMDDVETYVKAEPEATEPMIVDIGPDHCELTIEIRTK